MPQYRPHHFVNELLTQKNVVRCQTQVLVLLDINLFVSLQTGPGGIVNFTPINHFFIKNLIFHFIKFLSMFFIFVALVLPIKFFISLFFKADSLIFQIKRFLQHLEFCSGSYSHVSNFIFFRIHNIFLVSQYSAINSESFFGEFAIRLSWFFSGEFAVQFFWLFIRLSLIKFNNNGSKFADVSVDISYPRFIFYC